METSGLNSTAKTEGATLALKAATKSLFSAKQHHRGCCDDAKHHHNGGRRKYQLQNEEMVKEAAAFSSSNFELSIYIPVSLCKNAAGKQMQTRVSGTHGFPASSLPEDGEKLLSQLRTAGREIQRWTQ